MSLAIDTARTLAPREARRAGPPVAAPGTLPATPGLERAAQLVASAPSVRRLDALGTQLAAPPRGNDPPVQARLIQHRARLERPLLASLRKLTSPVVDALFAEPTTYVLRDDCALTDTEVHVLRADRKYILGETHNTGQWEARTRNWSIDTMQEGENRIGDAAPAPATATEPGTTPAVAGQPLEETAHVTLAAALLAVAGLRWMLPPGLTAGSGGLLTTSAKLNDRTLPSLQLLSTRYPATFGRFVETHPFARLRSPYEIALWEFAQHLTLAWQPRVGAMHDGIVAAKAAVASDPAAARTAQLVREASQAIIDHREVLIRIVDALTALAALGPDRDVAAASDPAIATAATTRIDPDLALVSASPLREAAMIRNVRAARAPLLVQVGEKHLANLAAGVGGTAVPVSRADTFEDLTRRR